MRSSASHVRKAQAALPETRFVNAYGPTEATTFATMYSIPRPFSPEAASVPIGTPITLTSCHVLDDQLQPVNDGEEGELFIGGDGVALGYLNLPEVTASRFLPDRFSGVPAGLMYRTGDLCRRLPDGNIDFPRPGGRAGEDRRPAHRAGRNRSERAAVSRRFAMRRADS